MLPYIKVAIAIKGFLPPGMSSTGSFSSIVKGVLTAWRAEGVIYGILRPPHTFPQFNQASHSCLPGMSYISWLGGCGAED